MHPNIDANNYSISQNFTTSRELLSFLSQRIQVSTSLVFDIGAGQGAITAVLKPLYTRVVAIEADKSLAAQLKQQFSGVTVIAEPFSPGLLQHEPFSVVANIPFRYTSDIMKSLLTNVFFQYGLLIMQKEAAEKFAGPAMSAKQTLVSAQASVDFTLMLARNCSRTDFTPKPKVNIVVLEIKRRDQSLVENAEKTKFADFLAYAFNKSVPTIEKAFPSQYARQFAKRVVSTLSIEEFQSLFKSTLPVSTIYRGYAKKIDSEKKQIQKVFRTRTDKNWKQFTRRP
jgi:23S rRNA (adenine-N6)-dimethyltransferase